MNKFLLPLALLAFASCGTTSKRIMTLPPLAPNAPVQMFYSKPDIKYDIVCEIDAKGNNSLGGGYTQKEDFEPMFKAEARKCGADGVIFAFMTGFSQGSVNAHATGIKIKSQTASVLSQDKIKAFSLAIQTHDASKVSEILGTISKNPAERAPSDDELINLGLYIATLDGLDCDAKVIDLLEKEYQGYIPKYSAIDMHSVDKPDSNSPLCKDVMARSLAKAKDIPAALIQTNNYYVAEMGYKSNLNKHAAAYNKLLIAAANLIVESCKKSSSDPACVMKAGFIDFSEKTKSASSAAVKKNAKDVLKILKN